MLFGCSDNTDKISGQWYEAGYDYPCLQFNDDGTYLSLSYGMGGWTLSGSSLDLGGRDFELVRVSDSELVLKWGDDEETYYRTPRKID